eukprot:gene23035-biopygen8823
MRGDARGSTTGIHGERGAMHSSIHGVPRGCAGFHGDARGSQGREHIPSTGGGGRPRRKPPNLGRSMLTTTFPGPGNGGPC